MIATMLELSGAALLVVLVSVLAYLAERSTPFGKLNRKLRQLILGVLFGGLAVLSTEFGITASGATMNVRDAAPLCAGLIFGAPAGIIAGVIGGVERWFAVCWGAGEYTRVACSVSTVMAGLFGAVMRKFMFDDKKPRWFYGFAIALVMEVVHMLMIFLTNLSDVHRAFTVISICTVPMVLMNAFAVAAALLAISLIGRKQEERSGQKKISQTFQRWLLICVIIAFLVTSVFTFGVQNQLSKSDATNLLSLNLTDVRADINDASDMNLLELTRLIARRIDTRGTANNAYLSELAAIHDVTEICLIDETGVITACTNEEFMGYDMASGEQSAAFMVLLDGESELVQSYQPISYDQSVSRKYAGVALKNGGFIQVGYDAARFQRDIDNRVIGITKNRHVGQSGRIIICNEDWLIVSDRAGNEGKNLAVTGIWIDRPTMPENTVFSAEIYGEPSRCMYVVSEGYTIVAVLPESEAVFQRNVAVYVMVFMEIIVFAIMFALIYFLIKKLVVENIRKINGSLARITSGDLNVTVDVRSNEEFTSLSDDINATVNTLKRYITEAEARIDKELAFAKAIQHSALPSLFPPYPHRHEFDIYAMMETAKEVGGDFYDFYLLDEDRLAFLIADVSGKGIPAAMFMMTAKTLIKSYAEAGLDVAEVFTQANGELCRNNDAGMFVTAWMAILNLKTGRAVFANAGHNPPLLKRANGAFSYLKSRPGFVLAGMEGMKYREQELLLSPGDTLYLYTDGVTEATDAHDELYGESRLLTVLNQNADAGVERLTEVVITDVDAFVGDAPQFDDITMLTLKYTGGCAS